MEVPMANSFTGFTPESLEFFENLAAHNNKAWFEEHRDEYEQYLLEPLKLLVSDLAAPMLAIDPELVTIPKVDKTISRLYRDTRFSRNKFPYKTALWISFKRRVPEWQATPCYFFEISAAGCRYGMGFYSASRQTMDNLRRYMESKPADFRKTIAILEQHREFQLGGDQYKRPLNPALPDDLQQWHSRKTIYFMCERPVSGRLFTRGICDDLRDGFTALKPLYDLLWRMCE
jgi:uncharacterized protein (TIGR02453 family)